MGEKKLYTDVSLQDYLAIEQAEDQRYEYYHGELYAMAGGTIAHGLICSNLAGELRQRLKGGECTALNSELKLELAKGTKYVYPDAMVVCGDIEESDVVTGAVKNPVLVIEVSSESSYEYDNTTKMQHYFRLPSVREYLMVRQDVPYVSLYRKAEGPNTLAHLQIAEGLDSHIHLSSIAVDLPLAEVYAGVAFPPPKKVNK